MHTDVLVINYHRIIKITIKTSDTIISLVSIKFFIFLNEELSVFLFFDLIDFSSLIVTKAYNFIIAIIKLITT